MAALCTLLACTQRQEGVRIAAPDDTCGALAREIVKHKALANAELAADPLPLMDCCSTTAQWAMSADRIEAAWLCPDAAQALLQKDGRFVGLGPALVNSEVLVVRGEGSPRRIAYSHKRGYQQALLRQRFGAGCETIPVTPTALPYLYEQGQVDGIVIDVLKGLSLAGRHLPLAGDGRDVVTYVLVVSRGFRDSAGFASFLAALQAGAERLNRTTAFASGPGEKGRLTPAQVKQLAALAVRFVPPGRQAEVSSW